MKNSKNYYNSNKTIEVNSIIQSHVYFNERHKYMNL